MTVLIFANGTIDKVEWIRPYLQKATAIIAANGGSRHLFRLQHPPNLLIGDADSIPSEIGAWLEAHQCQFMTSKAEKDETDLELALLYAEEEYTEDIVIFGTLGGRLDQTLGNILLLTHPQLASRSVRLLTENESAWLVRGDTEINGRIGDIVSLIPLSTNVQIKHTRNLQYPLNNEPLYFGPARGMSNVLTAEKAAVSVQSGLLLCIHNHTPTP